MAEPEDAQAVSEAEELARRAEALAARADELAREAETMAQSDEEIARLERELAALEEEKRALDKEFAEAASAAQQEGGESPGGYPGGGSGGRARARARWYGPPGDGEAFDGFTSFATAMASRLSTIGQRLGDTMSDAFSTMHLRAKDVIERSVEVEGAVPVQVENFSGGVT